MTTRTRSSSEPIGLLAATRDSRSMSAKRSNTWRRSSTSSIDGEQLLFAARLLRRFTVGAAQPTVHESSSTVVEAIETNISSLSVLAPTIASRPDDRRETNTGSCPICFVSLALPHPEAPVPDEASSAAPAIFTSCGHAFCETCLRESCQYRPECPLCRGFVHACDETRESCVLCVAQIPRFDAMPEQQQMVFDEEQQWEALFIAKFLAVCAVYTLTFTLTTTFEMPNWAIPVVGAGNIALFLVCIRMMSMTLPPWPPAMSPLTATPAAAAAADAAAAAVLLSAGRNAQDRGEEGEQALESMRLPLLYRHAHESPV